MVCHDSYLLCTIWFVLSHMSRLIIFISIIENITNNKNDSDYMIPRGKICIESTIEFSIIIISIIIISIIGERNREVWYNLLKWILLDYYVINTLGLLSGFTVLNWATTLFFYNKTIGERSTTWARTNILGPYDFYFF